MDHPYHNRLVDESDLKLGKRRCGRRLKNTGRRSKKQLLG
jgi:hypothetical protein